MKQRLCSLSETSPDATLQCPGEVSDGVVPGCLGQGSPVHVIVSRVTIHFSTVFQGSSCDTLAQCRGTYCRVSQEPVGCSSELASHLPL